MFHLQCRHLPLTQRAKHSRRSTPSSRIMLFEVILSLHICIVCFISVLHCCATIVILWRRICKRGARCKHHYAKDAAVVKYPWTSTETTPTFTGLPPHVVILATCEELKFELAKAKGGIIQDIKDDLDLRRIGHKVTMIRRKSYIRWVRFTMPS